ncbi:MAG: PIN domain-containing protein [Lachnospiraceae bacterium]|nr:PIN domain-containing protein [Lachnospiraceae bacterium]
MSTYLIDFENVKSGGLAGMDRIKKEDSVHLFWSARENKITIDMMEMIRSSESEIVMHKAVTGERDALDHQLCSYLGFLAGGRGETDFVIVSNDKAYDHLIEFWKKLDDRIHIQRVSEISRVSEAVHTAETTGETAAEIQMDASVQNMVGSDRNQNERSGQNERVETAERAGADSFGGRNSRRRERGSRYLKGGRTGRGSRKNNYTENYVEERAEGEKTVDRIRESGIYPTEIPEVQVKAENTEVLKTAAETDKTEMSEAVEAQEISVKSENTEKLEVLRTSEVTEKPEALNVPEKSEKTEVLEKPEVLEKREKMEAPKPKKESAAAYVVTGIRTGILVESGFTADGILKTDSGLYGSTAKKGSFTETTEKAMEKTAENTVKEVEEAAGKKTEEAAGKKAEEAAGKKVEEAAEKKAEETAGKKAEEAAEKKAEETAGKKTEETAGKKVEEAAEKKAEEAAEKRAEEAAGKKTVGKAGKKSEKTTVKNMLQEDPVSSGKTDVVMEDTGAADDDAGQEKKSRSRASRSTGRVKRGRPPKKEKTDYIPEIRIPIIEADVIAKCEEAAGADWTGEVVRLINHSKDKKELYSAIVKLLGQEKGRNVYHSIKVLK